MGIALALGACVPPDGARQVGFAKSWAVGELELKSVSQVLQSPRHVVFVEASQIASYYLQGGLGTHGIILKARKWAV